MSMTFNRLVGERVHLLPPAAAWEHTKYLMSLRAIGPATVLEIIMLVTRQHQGLL